MNDDHLSDHEWRLKQAAEGRAIYIPGKTVEQVKAERAAVSAEAAKRHAVTLDLSAADLDAMDKALPDLAEAIRDAAQVFTFLAENRSAGTVDPEDRGLTSIMRLAARAMRGLEDRELPALDVLDGELRRVGAERAKARLKGAKA